MLEAKISQEYQENDKRPDPTILAFLVSRKSTGSNLQVAVNAINSGEVNCKVQLVVSEKPGIKAIDVVEKNNLPLEIKPLKSFKSQSERDKYGKELAEFLNEQGIQIAILAAWNVIMSGSFFKEFEGIPINVHPGLIPDEKDRPFRFPDGTEAPWNRGLMTDDAVKNFLGGEYGIQPIRYVG